MKVCHVLISRCSFCKKIKVGKDERTPGLRARARQNELQNECVLARARGARTEPQTIFTPRTPFKGNLVLGSILGLCCGHLWWARWGGGGQPQPTFVGLGLDLVPFRVYVMAT